MSYRWHSQRQGSFDALRLTWIAIGTKKKSREEEEEQKQSTYKRETSDSILYNKRKDENLTPVSLSAQASFSFSYKTLISSDLHN